MITFKDLPLNPQIQQALEALGFTTPTEIQAKAIPVLLASEKTDLLGQAQTGTGKTLAFGLPLIQKIHSNNSTTQALIVAPTRELVTQICDSLRQVTKFSNISVEAIYGGVSMVNQLRALKKGVQIVVGTPGRLNDHIRRGSLSLSKIHTLVLDEADTMLDMGFKDEVDELLSAAPNDRQIWLFSATIKSGINALMRSHMNKPTTIMVAKKENSTASIKQYYAIVPRQVRLDALCRFIDQAPEFYGFIFCQTKALTAQIAERLVQRGYTANALHGDMNQTQRNTVIKQFKDKQFTILVATDVAARGIDVSDITHVINFSLPDDQESYVHRIGRTGRAGKEGISITLVSPSDLRRLQITARMFKFEVNQIAIPTVADIALKQQDRAMSYLLTMQTTPDAKRTMQIKAHIAALPKESLECIVTNLIDEKFLKLLPQEEITVASSNNSHGYSHGSMDSDAQELSINVGSDDSIDQNDLLEYMIANARIERNDVKKIKMLRRHSFVVLSTTVAAKVMSLNGHSLGGRNMRISETGEAVGGDRGHRRSGGGFNGGRQGGGYQRSDRSEGGRDRKRSYGNYRSARG